MLVSVPAIAGGAITVVAVGLAVKALLPARPDAGELLRLTRSPGPYEPVAAHATKRVEALADQVGTRLVKTPTVAARLPAKDLRLLEMSPAKLLGRAAAFGLLGLVLPQFFMVMVVLAGKQPPFAVPVFAALGCGAFFAFKCLDDVRDQAKKLREEYRYAVVSLLERLVLTRSADAGAGEALVRAASVGDSTPAVQMREALAHARLTGTNPWTALERLGDDLGVPDLAHPARALALAGEEKTAITSTLENQIDILRTALQTDRVARANAATEQMDIPALVVGLCLVVFMALPAFIKILNL
ncbi:hypothetical protein [Streptomyces sp. MW-W600-10]|uniref:hypothetical protein n=1 Tax=Streptomyces sp. MW-W600-10 TaxID=2829819 RepID=UPI001C440B0B|nr:hypothetical protein [Streptomyces sp. MW-W600-10]MBV7249284.1 hypothetical protein [Streptomyces sp. MW-W600-10]